MKDVKRFLKNLITIIILYIVLFISIYLYIGYLFAPIKTDVLSSQEQISILRGEMQDIKVYLDTTAIQLYALEQEASTQAEYIQGMIDQKAEHEAQLKAEHEKEIKQNREHDIIREHEAEEENVIGLREKVVVFTATVLKGLKDSLIGWRVNYGF